MPAPQPEIAASIRSSLAAATPYDVPYRHFYADGLLPETLLDSLATLPVTPPDPARFQGKREDQGNRFYANAATMAAFPALRGLAEALNSTPIVRAIAALCGAPLEGTRLRLEYALDSDGFWLAPHTDLGEKKFTGLISLGGDAQADLGTDIYGADGALVKRAPFRRNSALMFVPGSDTWHGFEKRPIAGARRSLILNYVGPRWRAQDQLAFPGQPVTLA